MIPHQEMVEERIRGLMMEHATDQAHIFDLDGTVIDRNVLVETTVGLTQDGVAPMANGSRGQLDELVSLYEDETSDGGHSQRLTLMALELVEHSFFDGVTEQSVQNQLTTSMDLLLRVSFALPIALIDVLRRRKPRQLIIMLTGTPQQMADVVAERLGFDLAIGCAYPKNNGRYMEGVSDLTPGKQKGLVMDAIEANCGMRWSESMAFGDSVYDMPMFKRVRYPLAINPKPSLQSLIRYEASEAWSAGRIAWIDQRVGERPLECDVWLPMDGGRLRLASLSEVLPPDILTDLLSSVDRGVRP